MSPVWLSDLRRALIAGAVYFLALFGLGFVLGTIRVLILVPYVGELIATAAELPIMLGASFFVCRWVLGRWRVSPTPSIRWMMAIWFLGLLLGFETLLGLTFFGRSISQQWVALLTFAGLLGLSAQILAGLLPVFLANGAVGHRSK